MPSQPEVKPRWRITFCKVDCGGRRNFSSAWFASKQGRAANLPDSQKLFFCAAEIARANLSKAAARLAHAETASKAACAAGRSAENFGRDLSLNSGHARITGWLSVAGCLFEHVLDQSQSFSRTDVVADYGNVELLGEVVR